MTNNANQPSVGTGAAAPVQDAAGAVEAFFNSQLRSWPVAFNNFEALKGVKEKTLDVEGFKIRVQFNPARIVSSGAKVDKASLSKRPCFLCEKNRPEEQFGMPFGLDYTILVNPFPIFPRHLTIPCNGHCDQKIEGRIGIMAKLADVLPRYTVFYNGPKCGASAPDHFHFQAGNSDFLTYRENFANIQTTKVLDTKDGKMSYATSPMSVWIIESSEPEGLEALFDILYKELPINEGEYEPMLNLLCHKDLESGKFILTVFPRKAHRPSFYGTEGEETMLLSPASVDMGGVFITPLEKDFQKLDAEIVKQVFDELCMSPESVKKIAESISKSVN